MVKKLRKEKLEDTPKRLKRRARAMENRIRNVQRHHITYTPEWIVPIFRGEHFLLTQLQRRKHVSRGFIQSIQYELGRLSNETIYDLDMPVAKYKSK